MRAFLSLLLVVFFLLGVFAFSAGGTVFIEIEGLICINISAVCGAALYRKGK